MIAKRSLINQWLLHLRAWPAAAAVFALLSLQIAAAAPLQFPRIVVQANQIAVPPEEDTTFDEAALKTDPDLEALMDKADRYRNDGNYRVAATLWQAVLQRSGDALYSDDQQTYFSLVQRVERVLSELPPEGLAAYRVTADAEAQEILNQQPPHDVTALATVVQKYFISSQGDDAAYELGSIFLDRFDFSGARRLFEKIATEYPDPSVPMDQVLLKIALCQSWLGNSSAAEAALTQSLPYSETSSEPRNYELVSRSIGELSFNGPKTDVSSQWKMMLGNETRLGVMPTPPQAFLNGDLVAVWQYYYEPKNTKSDRRDFAGRIRIGNASWGDANLRTRNDVERKLIDSWGKKEWRPNGNLLFDEERIYFRSVADMTAWSKSKIERQITNQAQRDEEAAKGKKTKPDPFTKASDWDLGLSIAWRSVWRNTFSIDKKTMITRQQLGRWGGYNNRKDNRDSPDPKSLPEVQLFGDKIASSIALHQDILYSVEGSRFDDVNRSSSRHFRSFQNLNTRRVRSNFLTAYDRTSGKLLWSLPEQIENNEDEDALTDFEDEENLEDYISGGGFMSAPIGFGNLIIVPVNLGGAISVYALDPANEGKTVWRSFLCDEPETSAEAWSPISMSIDGSDLFVNCGMGVVFVLDPASGAVRFARRYERDGQDNPFARHRSFNAPRYKHFDGWSRDEIIPYGKQMICFSSDRKTIEAYDRSSGQMLWACDMNPVYGGKVDYVIGVANDVLYAGGFDTIIAFGLKTEGKILWGGKPLFGEEQSKGRAMLTPAGLFVPVGDSIVQYALQADAKGHPQIINQTKVNLGTDAPVGNLYSDGNRIWVHGGNRLYALAPAEDAVD